MTEAALTIATMAFARIVMEPTATDLWELQKALLVIGGEPAARARSVVHAFHGCLRDIESKSASRRASRWGAALGTGAVAAASLSEMRAEQADPVMRLLEGGLPAVLEVGASVKTAQAWEIEGGLIYDGITWFLYDELWDLAATSQPERPPTERQIEIDRLLEPLLDGSVPDSDRAVVAVNVFLAVLAARLAPVFDMPSSDPERSPGS